DIPKTAAGPETGGEASAPEQGSDPQSSLARPAAPRVPFLESVKQLFRPRNGSSLREDLEDALADTGAGAGEETFSPAERAMLNTILRLREVRVEDVMIPRTDVEAVEITTTLGELLSLFEESGHSRMPVYADTLDDPRGMVHIRDVVAHLIGS